MSEPRSLAVGPGDVGTRLDVFLARHLPELSRTRLQDLIRGDAVLVSHGSAKPSYRLGAGEVVRVILPSADEDPAAAAAPAPMIELRVLHADDAVLVLDKPAGQVVHPALGHETDTMVNALLARYPDLADVEGGPRPGMVHRLDRGTSGVLVVARTVDAARALRRQFKARTVEKVYLALLRGNLRQPEAVIDAPVGRDPRRRQRMAAIAGGRPAQTAYRLLAEAPGYNWVEARPHTGRTHQIRVHFAAIGHPVAGDTAYGRRDRVIGRTALHAWRLSFDHPTTGLRVQYEAPLPADLEAALTAVGIDWRPG